MRVFLTGGTGFIGAAVARLLRERGDEVRALVRSPQKAVALRELGCELVTGDLSGTAALTEACSGMDAVVHGAAVYEVGIPEHQRAMMMETNVGGTERVLTAALDAGVMRAVYVSTVAVFGNTRGQVADEQWIRPDESSYTSAYEQSKVLAHRAAQDVAARGLPLVTVQPGVVYGAGDTSTMGDLLSRFVNGRLPVLPFPDLGVAPVHRDDVAAGVLLALDHGVPGECYVLAGPPLRVRELVAELAVVSGRRRPRFTLPTAAVRALVPLGPAVGPILGFPPNLREVLSSSDGVTFWASSDKAMDELGWTRRPLAVGLRDLVPA